MRLVQARIVTRDVPRLARFYEFVLGVAAAGSEHYVELQTTGARVAISSENAAAVCGTRGASPCRNRSMVLDFEVDDVDAHRQRIAGVVARFEQEPTNQPWGNRSMIFRDPDGNLINFYSRIPRR
jgi:uncharacterized glyoxalase superfamily protein PhnB